MGMDDIEMMPQSVLKSFIPDMSLFADRGHIIVDFDVRDIPLEKRRKVCEKYRPQDYTSEFAEYVVIGVIIESGDDLIVPPQYGRCTVGKKQPPAKKPGPDHINHATLVKLINGEA